MRACAILALSVCLLCSVTGCVEPETQIAVAPMQQVAELPGANLPVEMRPKNWTDSRGSGSCVNASTCFNLQWTAKPKHADHWRRTYAGGETDSSIRGHHDRERLGYYYTRNADPNFLNWVTGTRRSALIWYYPSHCVNFVGFHRDPSKPTDNGVYAWLCDNNRPSRFIKIPYAEFVQKWSGYGGFGLSLADPPVPPPLFNAVGT